MDRFNKQKNNSNLDENYTKLVKNKIILNNKSYTDVLTTLTKIFDSFGKKQVIPLIKLRKIWYTEIDSFLRENAYPRNISKVSKFVLSSDFLKELKGEKLKPDLYNTLENMIGKRFSHLEQFFGNLKKNSKRSITKAETDQLKRKFKFNYTQNILHLTVYDGSISYAINLETDEHLIIFNRLLPEIKLDGIQCHVGQIEKMKNDQNFVSFLAKDWHLITPKDIHEKCIPAFLNRYSKNQAILALYVTNQKDLDFLKNNNGSDQLLSLLKEKFIELRDILHKIKFILMKNGDLEKIKMTSYLLGGPFLGNGFNDSKFIERFQNKSLSRTISAKGNFAKIRNKLKSKI